MSDRINLSDLDARVSAAHAIAEALGAMYRHGGACRVLKALHKHGSVSVYTPERTIHSALHALHDENKALRAEIAKARAALEVKP